MYFRVCAHCGQCEFIGGSSPRLFQDLTRKPDSLAFICWNKLINVALVQYTTQTPVLMALTMVSSNPHIIPFPSIVRAWLCLHSCEPPQFSISYPQVYADLYFFPPHFPSISGHKVSAFFSRPTAPVQLISSGVLSGPYCISYPPPASHLPVFFLVVP